MSVKPQSAESSRPHASPVRGHVTLLGAGAGAVDLLTLRAVAALQSAQVVLCDELTHPELMHYAPQARWLRVGKRGGCKSTPQQLIQRLMLRYARRGLYVVRVKGGDPLLFGRAGEEMAFLQQHGVPYSIVNGISAGFAAAAALGVSLTHRDASQGVSFVTAHTKDGQQPDWGPLAASGATLVIYMGMRRLPDVCAKLLAHLPGSTPAAVVEWASWPQQRHLHGTLDKLSAQVADAGLGSPAIVMVGKALQAQMPSP